MVPSVWRVWFLGKCGVEGNMVFKVCQRGGREAWEDGKELLSEDFKPSAVLAGWRGRWSWYR